MIKHPQHIVLLRVQPFEQPVKQDKAGFAGENAVETPLQLALSFGCWVVTILLEIGVQPPDTPPDSALGFLMFDGDRDQLVDQSFGMHPAQGMPADFELPRAIGNNHHILQQPHGCNASPHGSLAGNTHWIGMFFDLVKTQTFKMRQPQFFIGKHVVSMFCQLINQLFWQAAIMHVIKRRNIDLIARIARPQELKEIQAAL